EISDGAASHGERLRGRIDDDGAVRKLVEAGDGDHWSVVINQVIVGFVGDENEIMTADEVRYRLHFRLVEHNAGRIDWIVEHEHASPRRHRAFERFDIEPQFLVPRHKYRHGSDRL